MYSSQQNTPMKHTTTHQTYTTQYESNNNSEIENNSSIINDSHNSQNPPSSLEDHPHIASIPKNVIDTVMPNISNNEIRTPSKFAKTNNNTEHK